MSTKRKLGSPTDGKDTGERDAGIQEREVGVACCKPIEGVAS